MQQPYVPQQPFTGTPNTIMGQPQPRSHSHSDGSFGMVFIVLAAVAVISAIACCLGRFCNRKAEAYTGPKQSKQSRSTNHRERDHPRKEHDLEFGFDNRMGHENLEQAKQNGHPSQRPHDKENDTEFSFHRKMRAPRSGYKPSVEGAYRNGPIRSADDV